MKYSAADSSNFGKIQGERGLPNARQPLRLGVGQRFQQNTVNDAEHRSVGANRDRDRQQRDDGEHWSTKQSSSNLPEHGRPPATNTAENETGSIFVQRMFRPLCRF
jgi:hypothetical protein